MSTPEPSSSRPLSPHLSVYRFHFSMALSILHRASGVAMTGALIIFIAWLWTAAYDAESFDCITGLLRTPVGIALSVAASFVFFFKCATGLRHLWWDTGRGFAISSIDTSGRLAIFGAVLLTALTWGYAYLHYFQE